MYDKLEYVEQRYNALERQLSDPAVIGNRDAYQKAVREHADLGKIVTVFRRYREVTDRIDESSGLLNDGDADIRALAKDDLTSLTAEKETLETDLKLLLARRSSRLSSPPRSIAATPPRRSSSTRPCRTAPDRASRPTRRRTTIASTKAPSRCAGCWNSRATCPP